MSRDNTQWYLLSYFSIMKLMKLRKTQSILTMRLIVAVVCVKRPADLCNMQVVENYWELDMNRFTCQPLGYGKTESHNPVPPIRIEPFQQDPRFCPVYQLVGLDKRLKKLRPMTEPRFWLSSKTPQKAISPSMICG